MNLHDDDVTTWPEGVKVHPDGSIDYRLADGPLQRNVVRIYGFEPLLRLGPHTYELVPPAGRQRKWHYKHLKSEEEHAEE